MGSNLGKMGKLNLVIILAKSEILRKYLACSLVLTCAVLKSIELNFQMNRNSYHGISFMKANAVPCDIYSEH